MADLPLSKAVAIARASASAPWLNDNTPPVFGRRAMTRFRKRVETLARLSFVATFTHRCESPEEEPPPTDVRLADGGLRGCGGGALVTAERLELVMVLADIGTWSALLGHSSSKLVDTMADSAEDRESPGPAPLVPGRILPHIAAGAAGGSTIADRRCRVHP